MAALCVVLCVFHAIYIDTYCESAKRVRREHYMHAFERQMKYGGTYVSVCLLCRNVGIPIWKLARQWFNVHWSFRDIFSLPTFTLCPVGRRTFDAAHRTTVPNIFIYFTNRLLATGVSNVGFGPFDMEFLPASIPIRIQNWSNRLVCARARFFLLPSSCAHHCFSA